MTVLSDALDSWLCGGSTAEFDAALDAINDDLTAFQATGRGTSEFTREDQIVWDASLYRSAAAIAARLTSMAQAATSYCDEKLADLVNAYVTPTEIPAYGVRFVKSLIAEGAGQADLHPATRRRAKAVMATLRSIQPTDEATDTKHPEPPVRDWSQLPPQFAGYKLEMIDGGASVSPPIPLPVSTDIAAFTADGLHPGEWPTRRETYGAWEEILDAWDVRRVAKAASPDVRPLSGQALRAWVLLLGHRLDTPDTEPVDLSDIRIVSPWISEQVVRPVWIGR